LVHYQFKEFWWLTEWLFVFGCYFPAGFGSFLPALYGWIKPTPTAERERRIQLLAEWDEFQEKAPEGKGRIRKLFAKEHGIEYDELVKVIHWRHETEKRKIGNPGASFVRVCDKKDKSPSGKGMAAIPSAMATITTGKARIDLNSSADSLFITSLLKALGACNAL